MNIVLDTSAAVAIVLENPGWGELDRQLRSSKLILAPDFMIAEATNVCWKYAHKGKLPRAACERALEKMIGLPDEYVSSLEFHQEAFGLAVTGQRAAYDMFYLALARRNGATLLSADKGLLAFAAKHDVKTLK